MMKEPIIAIDLRSRRLAIFDGCAMVRDFESFTDEVTARADASLWIGERTDQNTQAVRVLFPRITKVQVSGVQIL